MAELLICTVDIIGDDLYRNAKLPKRGHVITVQKDGWNWGVAELSDPMFLILKIPGALVSNFTSLLSPEISAVASLDPAVTDWHRLTNTLQYRGFRVDLDSLNVAVPATIPVVSMPFINGVQQVITVAPAPVTIASASTLLTYKLQQTAIVDPAIIGPMQTVIG